jgi:putative transposase
MMHAAYKLAARDGIAKLRQQVKWLETEHPDAAESLLEGLEQTFTVNRTNLSSQLIRCLCHHPPDRTRRHRWGRSRAA